jgi:hypothetical protein
MTSAQEERIKGLRLGYDISRLALYYLESERTAFEVSADYEIKRNFYITLEGGMQKYRLVDTLYNYNSDGYYTRLGLDYNILKNRADNQYEMVFGGVRYGYSRLNHTADNIIIGANYWGDEDITELESSTIQAHWIEATAGVRAELFKNVFIGWSFRWRVMIYQSRVPVMKPIYIPGYGKGDKKSLIGFNYYVYVRIPLGKYHDQ